MTSWSSPQVYTTQKGIGEIKNNPRYKLPKRVQERLKINPQVYTTQKGIGEIKNKPQV